PLPEDQPLGCIAGQMGRLYQVEQSDGTTQVWGHKHDVAWAEANPVALGVAPPALLFQLLSGSAGTIDLDSRRPPPGVGQKAFIADGERWQLVECSLSPEVESLYQALAQDTRRIWGDPGSEP